MTSSGCIVQFFCCTTALVNSALRSRRGRQLRVRLLPARVAGQRCYAGNRHSQQMHAAHDRFEARVDGATDLAESSVEIAQRNVAFDTKT
jgi:hypothetical protein